MTDLMIDAVSTGVFTWAEVKSQRNLRIAGRKYSKNDAEAINSQIAC